MTVEGIGAAMVGELFLKRLQSDLKSGPNRPSPSRRKLIPKPRQPGKFRPRGVPTVRDRVVQCAVKNILEPIFEAGFWHVSYRFGPDEVASAPWSTSASACVRERRPKMVDASERPTNRSSKEISRAASTTSITSN